MEATLRKWGSSLGLVIPREVIKENNFKEGDSIRLDIKKNNPLREAFGCVKSLSIDAQEMKNELRKEWKEREFF